MIRGGGGGTLVPSFGGSPSLNFGLGGSVSTPAKVQALLQASSANSRIGFMGNCEVPEWAVNGQ